MKKIILTLCCFLLCGCGNQDNKPLLIGEWLYEGKVGIDEVSSRYNFYDDNTFSFSTCFSNIHYCDNGYAEWKGTYKLNNDIIALQISEENKVTDRYGFRIVEPATLLIVDFDNMYFCDRNDGLDCKERFEKYNY